MLTAVLRSPQRYSVVSRLQMLERFQSRPLHLPTLKSGINMQFIWLCLQYNIVYIQYKIEISVVYRDVKCHVIEVEIFNWFGQQTHGGISQYKLIITIRGILDLNQHWDRGGSE